MDENGHDSANQSELSCRHFLLCRTLWYDPALPGDHSLAHIIATLTPPAGSSGHFVEPRLFAYVQLFGPIADYILWIALFKLSEDPDSEDAYELKEWGPFQAPVTGIDFVEPHAYQLMAIPFDGPGFYDFRVRAGQGADWLATERVHVPLQIEELP